MKVDCYNACSCEVIEVPLGGNFYYNNILYLRISGVPHLDDNVTDKCWAVRLDTGDCEWFKASCIVTLASCKVITDIKDVN